MNMKKKRRSFEAGHFRKFLLIVDESQEADCALYYAASRIQRSSGSLQVEEETTKAKALFRMFRRKLNLAGFKDVASEDVIREGAKGEEIRKLIDEDEDIAVLVLGASTDPAGPGPLVASLAAGTAVASFPIPVTIVPGTLELEDIQALA